MICRHTHTHTHPQRPLRPPRHGNLKDCATRRTRAGGRDGGGERTVCVYNNIYIAEAEVGGGRGEGRGRGIIIARILSAAGEQFSRWR